MTVLIVIETLVLIVLSVLVAGLLRAYATVLQRLHRLDGGADAAPTGAPPFRTAGGVVPPPDRRQTDRRQTDRLPAERRPADLGPIAGRAEWAAAHDISGVGLTGEVVAVRTVAVGHDTVLIFLSSGCAGCGAFWEQLLDRRASMSFGAALGSARLLVVTKSAAQESVSLLAALCPAGVDLVMSSDAWTDYEVPGSPYVVVVDGRTGRVKGEGSGTSLSQVSGLVALAVGDRSQPGHDSAAAPGRNPVGKPRADIEREEDVDRVLLAAGISPGHASLYGANAPDLNRTAEHRTAEHRAVEHSRDR